MTVWAAIIISFGVGVVMGMVFANELRLYREARRIATRTPRQEFSTAFYGKAATTNLDLVVFDWEWPEAQTVPLPGRSTR